MAIIHDHIATPIAITVIRALAVMLAYQTTRAIKMKFLVVTPMAMMHLQVVIGPVAVIVIHALVVICAYQSSIVQVKLLIGISMTTTHVEIVIASVVVQALIIVQSFQSGCGRWICWYVSILVLVIAILCVYRRQLADVLGQR